MLNIGVIIFGVNIFDHRRLKFMELINFVNNFVRIFFKYERNTGTKK